MLQDKSSSIEDATIQSNDDLKQLDISAQRKHLDAALKTRKDY